MATIKNAAPSKPQVARLHKQLIRALSDTTRIFGADAFELSPAQKAQLDANRRLLQRVEP